MFDALNGIAPQNEELAELMYKQATTLPFMESQK